MITKIEVYYWLNEKNLLNFFFAKVIMNTISAVVPTVFPVNNASHYAKINQMAQMHYPERKSPDDMWNAVRALH